MMIYDEYENNNTKLNSSSDENFFSVSLAEVPFITFLFFNLNLPQDEKKLQPASGKAFKIKKKEKKEKEKEDDKEMEEEIEEEANEKDEKKIYDEFVKMISNYESSSLFSFAFFFLFLILDKIEKILSKAYDDAVKRQRNKS